MQVISDGNYSREFLVEKIHRSRCKCFFNSIILLKQQVQSVFTLNIFVGYVAAGVRGTIFQLDSIHSISIMHSRYMLKLVRCWMLLIAAIQVAVCSVFTIRTHSSECLCFHFTGTIESGHLIHNALVFAIVHIHPIYSRNLGVFQSRIDLQNFGFVNSCNVAPELCRD